MTNQDDKSEAIETNSGGWKMSIARIITIVPPAAIIGAWIVSASNNEPYDPMTTATGQLWWSFVLWPFALGYVLYKRKKE